MSTHSLSNPISDSATAGTAISIGNKVNNGTISKLNDLYEYDLINIESY